MLGSDYPVRPLAAEIASESCPFRDERPRPTAAGAPRWYGGGMGLASDDQDDDVRPEPTSDGEAETVTRGDEMDDETTTAGSATAGAAPGEPSPTTSDGERDGGSPEPAADAPARSTARPAAKRKPASTRTAADRSAAAKKAAATRAANARARAAAAAAAAAAEAAAEAEAAEAARIEQEAREAAPSEPAEPTGDAVAAAEGDPPAGSTVESAEPAEGPHETASATDVADEVEIAPAPAPEAAAPVEAESAVQAEPEAEPEAEPPVEPEPEQQPEPEDAVGPDASSDLVAAAPAARDDEPEERPVVLSIKGLGKRYGGTVAVEGIDLDIRAGSFYGIVGPNGAGTTTTLSIVTGLLRPDEGSVTVLGADVWADPAAAKRSLGVLPDRLRLFDRLTGAQLLYYSATLRGLDGATARKRSADLATAFGLQDALGRLVSDYSVGMTKKIALAAAVIHSPRVLVLDEPFESVDPVSAATVTEVLQRYVAGGGTVLLSSHSMDLVERICDSVAVIVDGHVLASGTVDEVRAGRSLEQTFVELAGGRAVTEGMEWLQSFSD